MKTYPQGWRAWAVDGVTLVPAWGARRYWSSSWTCLGTRGSQGSRWRRRGPRSAAEDRSPRRPHRSASLATDLVRRGDRWTLLVHDRTELGGGLYTVSEVCLILQPSMTPRKVHYWLDTGLLSEGLAIRRGKGTPTLLTFRQLLEVRTVQRMRDDLRITLPRVREAFEWVLERLLADSPAEIHFERGGRRTVIARTQEGDLLSIPTAQRVLDIDLTDLSTVIETSRNAWEQQAFVIPGRPAIVSNARIQAGSPTISGTRMETSILAGFLVEGRYSDETIERIVHTYPRLTGDQIRDALEFEGGRWKAA